jgi:hypothetical protein
VIWLADRLATRLGAAARARASNRLEGAPPATASPEGPTPVGAADLARSLDQWEEEPAVAAIAPLEHVKTHPGAADLARASEGEGEEALALPVVAPTASVRIRRGVVDLARALAQWQEALRLPVVASLPIVSTRVGGAANSN